MGGFGSPVTHDPKTFALQNAVMPGTSFYLPHKGGGGNTIDATSRTGRPLVTGPNVRRYGQGIMAPMGTGVLNGFFR